jgi:hypothetical protein
MKNLTPLAVCILAMCIATYDSLAQCTAVGNNPDIQIQWRSNSIFDYGHKVGDNFTYSFDFGTVDEQLSAIQQIKFSNCASTAQPSSKFSDDNSFFKVTAIYCTGTTAADWDLSDLVDFASAIPAVPAGGTSTNSFDLVFHPVGTSPVDRKVVLLISYRDQNWGPGEALPTNTVTPTTCSFTEASLATRAATLSITLIGKVAPRVPMNSILVIDRSGSMADPAYTMGAPVPKIDALQSAVSVYFDAMGAGDNYSAVTFNSSAATPVGWTAKTTTSTLDPALSGLVPTGSTSIGAGFGGAITQSNMRAPAAGHKNIVILQTDGIQNTYPNVAEAKINAGSTYHASDMNVYTVGLGADVQDTELISIAGSSNRFFKVLNDPMGSGKQDLQNFYFKIFAQANNLSMVTDPTILIDLNHGPVTAFRSTLTLADKTARFLVIEGDYTRELYKTQLVNPKGDIVTSASNIGASPVEVVHNKDHTIYTVHGAIDNTFIGEWKLNVVPNNNCKDSTGCKVPVSFSVAAKSNLTMDMASVSESYLPGAPIKITTRLAESRLPLADAFVSAVIRTPEGKKFYGVRLLDDGKGVDQFAGDGVYSTVFTETAAAGTYEVKVASIVKTLKGQVTTREGVQYVPMQYRQVPVVSLPKDCMACWLKWVIAIVIMLMLVRILFILYALRKR